MEVALGDGELDVLGVEAVPDAEQDLAAEVGGAVLRVADPEAQFQVHRDVAETEEPADRRQPGA